MLERRAPGHHGYQRACDLISGQASSGPLGSPVFACAGKTEPPSRLIFSQTLAGKITRLFANDEATWSLCASKSRPRASTLQAIRASLLAGAIASTLRCSRFLAASIQCLSPWPSHLLGLIFTRTTHAAWTNRVRR